MLLEFCNSERVRREIGRPKTIKEAYQIINKFLKDHNYKSYYTRINFLEKELEFDVGSWSEFFYLSDLCEDYKEQINAFHEERNRHV